jgi:HK97 family phage prohead protease
MDERGPVEIRTATIEAVAYPDRTIALVVVPYDEWTPVEVRGRVLEESFAPGAFGAIRNRARKFLVNMEHDPDRWVGSVLELDGANERGLRARVRIRRNPEGDQALDDAADGLLGASIGFAAAPADMTETGDRRRIHKAYLDHIALTATPAYAGAEILEVRSTTPVVTPANLSATPNLDRVRAELAEMNYRSAST